MNRGKDSQVYFIKDAYWQYKPYAFTYYSLIYLVNNTTFWLHA